jgi:hypothetical protein
MVIDVTMLDDVDLMVNPVVKELASYFVIRGIPLKLVNLQSKFEVITDIHQQVLRQLYQEQALMLVRPDLYIAWNLSARCGNSFRKISTIDLQQVAQTVCAEAFDENEIHRNTQTMAWLTRRFITNIQGYRHLHKAAIYFENQDKAKVIESIVAKNRKAATNEGGVDLPVRLLTKGVLWESQSSMNIDMTHLGSTTDRENPSASLSSNIDGGSMEKELLTNELTNVSGTCISVESVHACNPVGYVSVPTTSPDQAQGDDKFLHDTGLEQG